MVSSKKEKPNEPRDTFGYPRPAPKPSSTKKSKGRKPQGTPADE